MRRFVLLMVFGAAACGGSDVAAPAPRTPVGTFTMKTMDGRVSPASETVGNLGPWIVRSTIVFTAAGTYSLSQTDSTHDGIASTITEAGAWTMAPGDSVVQMATTTAGRISYSAVLSGNSLKRVAYTHTFVFERQ